MRIRDRRDSVVKEMGRRETFGIPSAMFISLKHLSANSGNVFMAVVWENFDLMLIFFVEKSSVSDHREGKKRAHICSYLAELHTLFWQHFALIC